MLINIQINLNLPPEVRVQHENMILIGFIPRPKEPKNIDSFLFPMIQEFKILENGIPGSYNAARHGSAEDTFLLRAYITIVAADMIGSSKVS